MNQNMLFVAVVGGLRDLDQAQRAAAEATGKLIGVELAKAGFGLVVYFSDPESLEPHVVSGYIEGLAGGVGAIRVRYAESQRGQVRFGNDEITRPELFQHDLFPGPDWEAPFYRSLAEKAGVDAVLLLGGARSTLIAGNIAVARELPVLAVNSFGGAANKIWSELANRSARLDAWGTRPAANFIQRLKSECQTAADARRELARGELLIAGLKAQGHRVAYAAGAFVLLLTTLLLGLAPNPLPVSYPFLMLLGLSCAGATGSLVRTVLWGPENSVPRTSLLLGCIAGFTVGLTYLLPQWVGDTGILTDRSDGITVAHKIQFAYAVLVALSAGIGFDTVFNKLRDEAGKRAVGPATG